MDNTLGYRKIELQSPQDLSYLLQNAERLAREKLDTYLPPAHAQAPTGEGEQEDVFRKRVRELVEDYIHKTYALAAPSILLNGLPATESSVMTSTHARAHSMTDASEADSTLLDESENYEPHDPTLLTRIQTLFTTLETETEKVAKLRRTAPAAAAAACVAQLQHDIDAVQAEATTTTKTVGAMGLGVGPDGFEDRLREMERAFGDGVRKLHGVEKEIAETRGRLERAEIAVGVIEGR